MSTLSNQFGHLDIYLFDQVLKGRIAKGMRILDVGCGGGRNLYYFLKERFEVMGADPEPAAIQAVQRMASELFPEIPESNFRAESAEALSFADGCADVVICNAVLHFARDENHFWEMLEGAWRALRPGGLFFSRLASTIGMEGQVRELSDRRYVLPDGSTRFLVDAEMLSQAMARLGGDLLDPIKTTVVQNQRAMTTWVVSKSV